MKIRDKLLKLLHDNGLFETEAKAVLDLYLSSPLGEPMKSRMDDDESGYPQTTIVATWMGVCASAVEWIDKNKPHHWARAMFAFATK